jgi:hypothetical protein
MTSKKSLKIFAFLFENFQGDWVIFFFFEIDATPPSVA